MSRFASALAETRGQLQNPDRWFINMVSGHESASGVRVDEDVALSSTAIFAGTRFLGETIASLPLPIYRRREDGRGRDMARDHSAFRLLHDDPNPELTSLELREMLQIHTILGGTCFAIKVRDGGGTVRELWPITPYRVEAKRDASKALYFSAVLPEEDSPTRIPASEMFWLRGFSRYGIMGESAIMLAKEAVGLAVAAERFGASFFGGGTQLSGVLEAPVKLNPEVRDAMHKSWERKYSGLRSAHKVALLEEGTKFQAVGTEPDKAQFIDTRTFQIQEASRILNIPPPFLHDLSRATFSNIDALALWLEKFTVRPWLVRWEQAINKRVLEPDDRPEVFAEHIIEGLLRGDFRSRMEGLQIQLQNGVINRNEWRAKENMNPIEGGDAYLVNGNMAVLDDEGTPRFPPREEPPGQTVPRSADESLVEYRATRSLNARFRLRDSHVEAFRLNARTVLEIEVKAIRERADALLRKGKVSEFLLWLEDFYRDHRDVVARIFGPVLTSYAVQIREEVAREVLSTSETPEFDDFVRDYIDGFTNRHVVKSTGAVRAILRDAEDETGADDLIGQIGTWVDERSLRLAESETVRGAGALAKAAYIAFGVSKLVWRKRGAKSCPLCTRLDGRVIDIKQNFVDNGDVIEVDEPGTAPFRFDRSIGHPPGHNGCDCGVGAAL